MGRRRSGIDKRGEATNSGCIPRARGRIAARPCSGIATVFRCGPILRFFARMGDELKMRKPTSKTFLELLEPHRDAFYGYARRASWRMEDAPDIVQEAVMTGWREFARFQLGTNFRAWMFRILVNTIFRFNKKVKRDRSVALDAVDEDVFLAIEREDAWGALLHRPDMLRQVLDERLVSSLDNLSVNERQCLLLRTLEDFSCREIASMMRIPLGTVLSHIHRARIKLRKDLAALAVEQRLIKEATP